MKKISSLLLAGALACAATSWAVPAKRAQHTVTQPDGSQLILTLAGDEFCHYYLTDDNQPVMLGADGTYCFAVADADGLLAPSQMRASNIAERTTEQTQFLNTYSDADISNAIANSRRLSNLRTAANSRGVDPDDVSGIGIDTRKKHPTTGNVKALVVLVAFSDVPFSQSDEETLSYFSNMLNEEGFSGENATGSAYDYFLTASDGKFTPQFDVYGPVVLLNDRKYYGGNNAYGSDSRPQQMVIDMANTMVEQGFDFSPYDNNGDGIVDNVFVFYAGVGEAQSGLAESVWPHQSRLSALYWPRKGLKVAEGLFLDSYACSSELNDQRGQVLDGIGTFVHEYSHVLGLPDLYNTDAGNASYTPNKYSVLDYGPYSNNSRTPPTYSSYERNALGWIDLQPLLPQSQITLNHLEDSNKAYVITTDTPNEFFLFENRQQKGWDTYLPGHGMLVWHVHYVSKVFESNIVNNDPEHQYVDIIEAGTRIGLSVTYARSYPFPGSLKVTSLEYPKIQTWDGGDLELPISDITETDGVITANVGGDNSGIVSAAADSPVSISINGRTIAVDGANASGVTIYDSMGRIVSRGAESATVAPGIYVVATPGYTAKVAVR